MKRALAIAITTLGLLALNGAAHAQGWGCTTNSILVNGRTTVCQTCCYGAGGCNTVCS